MGSAELRAKRAEKHNRLRAIHAAAEAEDRSLNEAESREWADLTAQIAGLTERIEREEKLDGEERLLAAQRPGQPVGSAPAAPKAAPSDWRSFGEFLGAIRNNRGDPRLQYHELEGDAEERVLSMGVGGAGGFLVPTQFRPELLAVDPQAAIFRPRATPIPAGDPPDSAVTMPALNQTGALGVFSGVTVTWIGEGGAKPEAEPSFLEVTLEPQEVAAHTWLTDKLLRNSEAAATVVQRLLRQAIMAAEDWQFLRGAGVGTPRGIIGHPATINQARAGAGAIVYADLVAMYSQVMMGGPLVWIGSPTTLPQLTTMVDAAGGLIWQPNAREGAPGTIMGFPFLINQRSPVLGAVGDLMLADLSYYLIKDGSGPYIDMSPHVRFLQNQTAIKAFWNVDGQPWLTGPMTLEDGVTQTSPFVALQ
jgi:HK97 family phage major capsid protein